MNFKSSLSKSMNSPRGKPQPNQQRPRVKRVRRQPSRINQRGNPSIGSRYGTGVMSSAPVAMSKVVRTPVPRRFDTLRNGDCHIVHREYISDILASSGSPSVFGLTQYSINPGQSEMFPWLAAIAGRFESYRFASLRFDYETEAPSSLGGTLVLSVDYDASDAPPTSKQQALAYRNTVRSAPWTPCCHESDREDLAKQNSYFVRPAGQPVGTDIKLYDVGNLNVITQGVTTAGATCGELYVEYDVLLMTPVLEAFARDGYISAATGTTANIMVAPTISGGNIGVSVSGTIFSFTGLQIGAEYLVQLADNAAGSTITSGTDSGLALKTQLAPNGSVYVYSATFTCSAINGTLQLTASGAITDVILTIVLLNPSLGF